jgi:DNA-binding winged helix-turn-helix (wHTH) protein
MVYAFGPFRYDAEQKLLFRDSEVVPLVPKVVGTLHALIERHGRIVDKDELIQLVWPDTVVEEGGLARNISLLRKALGEEQGDSYIETVPRRGYRFIGKVAQPETPRPPSRRPAMAIAPFECLAPCPSGSGTGEAFQEVVTAELSQLNNVQVLSPATVRRYRRLGISMVWMARLLNLDALMEGDIQPLSGGTRVTARLADVHSGKLIWAENLDAPVGDFRSTQQDVAKTIAQHVGKNLGTTREEFR